MDKVSDLQLLFRMQHLVGGDIERIRTTRLQMKHNVALIDEDARTKGRLPNYRGTSGIGYPTIIHGTIAVVGEEFDGEQETWTDINE
jgi:hypothetical protein